MDNTYKDRVRFWESIFIKECIFQKEKTVAHGICFVGLLLWIIFSVAFLAYVILKADTSLTIRVVGFFASFWAFYLYIRSRHPAQSWVSVRILALKPIGKSSQRALQEFHSKMVSGVRYSSRVVVGLFVLFIIVLFENIQDVDLLQLFKVYIPAFAMLTILVSLAFQYYMVTLPFLRQHSRDELSMATGSNILSVYSMQSLLDLSFPFLVLISANAILVCLSKWYDAYATDFLWIIQIWVFLFGIYILLVSISSVLKICIPIFLLMPSEKQIYTTLIATLACCAICAIFGGYSITFCIPFLFTIILNANDLSENSPLSVVFLIALKACFSGLSSVLTVWILNLSGITLLLHSDIYIGLIMAVLFDHLISFCSYRQAPNNVVG